MDRIPSIFRPSHRYFPPPDADSTPAERQRELDILHSKLDKMLANMLANKRRTSPLPTLGPRGRGSGAGRPGYAPPWAGQGLRRSPEPAWPAPRGRPQQVRAARPESCPDPCIPFRCERDPGPGPSPEASPEASRAVSRERDPGPGPSPEASPEPRRLIIRERDPGPGPSPEASPDPCIPFRRERDPRPAPSPEPSPDPSTP